MNRFLYFPFWLHSPWAENEKEKHISMSSDLFEWLCTAPADVVPHRGKWGLLRDTPRDGKTCSKVRVPRPAVGACGSRVPAISPCMETAQGCLRPRCPGLLCEVTGCHCQASEGSLSKATWGLDVSRVQWSQELVCTGCVRPGCVQCSGGWRGVCVCVCWGVGMFGGVYGAMVANLRWTVQRSVWGKGAYGR